METNDAGRMPTIELEVHGDISAEDALAIRYEVLACYRTLQEGPLPVAVSLGLFDTLERWRDYAVRCREEAGVVTAGDEGFLATHDAWEGSPRLSVCMERMLSQPLPLQQGALHQVVAHSILHGGPDYYRFTIPSALIDASEALGLEREILLQLLYFVSIAVKGHEAASLLVAHGYIQDQVALALYQLSGNDDDIALWKMARWEPRARRLYLAAQLKPLLYMRPLLPHAPVLAAAARMRLAHLPEEEIGKLEGLVEALAAQCSGDTHRAVSAGLVMMLNRL